ncbi:MAG: SDR family NAD(P)-dependent oxidoreductase [Phycisphaera sp.]|nr:SDR family NAD(P)-dependent oxidoreductase [Phycisphaera sp.]
MSEALQDHVAIVTGAGRGIGKAIALSLAQEGCRVALAARSEKELHVVAEMMEEMPGEGFIVATDLTDEAQVAALVAKTVERWGQLDIVINNAGLGVFAPFVDTTVDDFDRIMAVNARGTFLVCRESIPHLKARDVSWVINIASVVGVKGYANQAAYTASKHAVMGLTKVLARELQDDGVRVHAICPGGVHTEMVAAARPDLDTSVLMTPEEIADAVLFLVSHRGNAVIDEIHLRRRNSTPFG